jgi:hypothetical protein
MTDEKKIPDEELKEVDGGVLRNPDGPNRTADRPYATDTGGRPKPSWADDDKGTTTGTDGGSTPQDFDPSGN